MRICTLFLAAAAALLLSVPVAADVLPARSGGSASRCQLLEMCVDEVDTGPCQRDPGGGDDNIVDVQQRKVTVSLYANGSTASAWSCLPYGSSGGYDATDKQVLHSTALSEGQRMIEFRGGIIRWWVECDTITGGNVDVTALVCAEIGR